MSKLCVRALQADGEGTAGPGLSCEAGLFPFLFPLGSGMFRRGQLTQYLQYRMRALFTVFTIFKPYLLLMYLVRQAHVVAKSISSCVLERHLADYKKKKPDASEEVREQHMRSIF